jgi:hypothetical protein
MPIQGPWRHGSLKEYFANVQAGRTTPTSSGGGDKQIDSACKVAALVAAHCEDEDVAPLLARTEAAIRVTQDTDEAVAMGLAFARVRFSPPLIAGWGGRQVACHLLLLGRSECGGLSHHARGGRFSTRSCAAVTAAAAPRLSGRRYGPASTRCGRRGVRSRTRWTTSSPITWRRPWSCWTPR